MKSPLLKDLNLLFGLKTLQNDIRVEFLSFALRHVNLSLGEISASLRIDVPIDSLKIECLSLSLEGSGSVTHLSVTAANLDMS